MTTDAANTIHTVIPTGTNSIFIGDIVTCTVGGGNTAAGHASISMRVSAQIPL